MERGKVGEKLMLCVSETSLDDAKTREFLRNQLDVNIFKLPQLKAGAYGT